MTYAYLPQFVLTVTMAVSVMGCQSIPSNYQGHFEKRDAANSVEIALEVTDTSITLIKDNKAQALSLVANGFDESIQAALQGSSGIYVLPSLESLGGVVVNTPWIPRMSILAGFYQGGTQDSQRYSDVYLVLPNGDNHPSNPIGGVSPIPVSGKVNTFDAQIVYLQIDQQVQSVVPSIKIQLAPLGHAGAESTSIMGIIETHMLSFSPGPTEETITAELLRK